MERTTKPSRAWQVIGLLLFGFVAFLALPSSAEALLHPAVVQGPVRTVVGSRHSRDLQNPVVHDRHSVNTMSADRLVPVLLAGLGLLVLVATWMLATAQLDAASQQSWPGVHSRAPPVLA